MAVVSSASELCTREATHKKTPNQLQLACRRSGCCAARKPLGFHTPAEPATFDPTPIKDRGTLVLRNSFGTARASTWLWWWSALPQRARSHQNNTPNQQLLASPPSTGPSHRTQAPGLPHACRAGHVRPYPYERAPRFGLSDIRSLQPVLRRAVVVSSAQRARSHQNKTHIWFMKLSVTMVMVHHGSLKSPVDPPMVHHGSPKSQISGFMDQTGS